MKTYNGAQSLAEGALQSGVSYVSGYPGSPATAIVDHLLELSTPDQVRIEWAINEKVAAETAYGYSLGGRRALLCVKSVGLNIALDPLMAINLAGCDAGFVILVGDDPGSWGSQNEQDSRAVALSTELPILEPGTVSDARLAMVKAFQLSEEIGVPVFVRVIRALTLAEGADLPEPPFNPIQSQGFHREFERRVVLPVNAVQYHHRLHKRLEEIKVIFENSPLNEIRGAGSKGVIASGFIYQKIFDLFEEEIPVNLRVLRLGTFFPLPDQLITNFLKTVKRAIVLEETFPLLELRIRNLAQRADLLTPIFGRDTDHVPQTGELFSPDIAGSLNKFLPSLDLRTTGDTTRPRPSLVSPSVDCPYIPIFNALIEVIERFEKRDETIIVGDPGCMVRFQESHNLMDIKTSLGSSIGLATGIVLSQRAGENLKRVVAISGDSSLLHSNFPALIDASRVGAHILVLVLDNATTALSGRQPHPGSPLNARGEPRSAVDLSALALNSGASSVDMIDIDRGDKIQPAIEASLNKEGVNVLIARGLCPGCPHNSNP